MAISIEGFELIRSLRDGDNELFEEVVREYRAELLRHARRKMHDDAAAEDVVQETLARAFRALGRLRDDSNIRPWLHHICANVCIDEANRRLRETDKVARLHLDPLTSRDLLPGVDEQLGLSIDDTPLQTALDSLSPEHRHALVLRFVDELEYDELAERAGISEQNARARVSRARTMMRVALNGAAAIPVFVYGLLRRTPRASAALDRAEALPASTSVVSASTGAGHLGRLATAVAPAIEAAGAVAAAAPTAAPVLAKVAVGVGLVATATFATTGSESPAQRAAFTAAPAAVQTTTDGTVAGAPGAAVTGASQSSGPAVAVAVTVVDDQTVVTITASVDAGQAGSGEPGADSSTSGAAGSGSAGTAPASTAPATTAAPTTTVVGARGTVAVMGLAVDAAGPRLDLRGPATLTVGERTITGRLSGRVSVATSADRDGRHRVDGTLTLSFDGGSVQIRLAGFATVDPADPVDQTDQTDPIDPTDPADTSVPTTGPATGDGTEVVVGPDEQSGGSATMSATPPAPPADDASTQSNDADTRAAVTTSTVPQYRLTGRFTTLGDAHGLLSSGTFGGRLSSTDLVVSFGS